MAKLWAFGISGLVTFIYYYFFLPPINVGSILFWCGIFIFFGLLALLSSAFAESGEKTEGLKKFSISCFLILIVIALIGAVGSAEIFHAKTYQKLLTVEESNFNTDISQIEIEQLPIMDRASAERLGDRRMGEMVDLVSQFEVSNDYTQINFCDRPVRTTPLEYGGFIKWVANKSDGVPAYINVDMVTQDVELVRFDDEGMKYVPTAYFGKDMMRHLRFNYPTKMFGEANFEIDDEGNPYYIVSVVEKTIFMFGGEDVTGVIILNPIDGSSEYYDVSDVPSWVDRVYPEDMLTQQLNWHGQYKNGWWNTVLSKKGVLNCTEGYNYLAIDDDIWLYTGFTSVGKDESNVGFMLVNMRTKQAKYYACPGAEEYSAMEAAQGAVANFGYTATFPLLINVNDEPTYLMALKDSYSLVKMYALVNVTEYQNVATGKTLEETFANYAELMGSEFSIEVSSGLEVKGNVYAIKHVVKDGNSYYYMQLVNDNNIYIASIELNDMLPFIGVNDEVFMTYMDSGDEFKKVLVFEKN